MMKPEGDPPIHYVSFRLDRQHYALPLTHVERALRLVAITPAPELPSWVAGVINLHGRVVPVVDLRQRWGHPSRRPHLTDRLLVVPVRERTIALWVDEVTEVLAMSASQVEPPPDPLDRSPPLAGVIRRDEELILVLDPACLVPERGEDGDTETGRGGDTETGRGGDTETSEDEAAHAAIATE